MVVVTFPMPAGSVFDWHTHTDHQPAWAASGVLTVRISAAAWVLPPSRALWISAGLRHETLSAGTAPCGRCISGRPAALAAGEPVGNVARRVGYESVSAFVAAFRRETGVTPARYFRG